jgi:hypothetical protein
MKKFIIDQFKLLNVSNLEVIVLTMQKEEYHLIKIFKNKIKIKRKKKN